MTWLSFPDGPAHVLDGSGTLCKRVSAERMDLGRELDGHPLNFGRCKLCSARLKAMQAAEAVLKRR